MMRTTHLPAVMLVVLVVTGHAWPDEKILNKRTSRYNNIVVSEDDQGLRTMWFENRRLRQSVAKPSDPEHVELAYIRAMPIGLSLVDNPRRMAFIGLGGGTLPSFLHRHYPKVMIDAVEIDPGVVDVAKEFFGFREDATMKVHVQDGRQFIQECRRPYDLIFLDAYSADSIPYSLATREFLLAVRQALSPKGIVVANIPEPKANRLYDSMVRTYQDVFAEVYVVDVRTGGNRIVIAQPYKGRLRGVELAQKARRVSREKQFRFDIADFILNGFLPVEKNPSSGQVLTDNNNPSKNDENKKSQQ